MASSVAQGLRTVGVAEAYWSSPQGRDPHAGAARTPLPPLRSCLPVPEALPIMSPSRLPRPSSLVPWILPAVLAGCSGHSTVSGTPVPVPGTSASVQSSGASTAATLKIPPGHLPSPGMCRIWYPGTPPGRQPKAGSCSVLEPTAPAGSWVVYRPTKDKKLVYVREISPSRAGVVARVQVFDANSGAFVRSEKP